MKIDRALFVLLMAIVNGGVTFIVPLIPNPAAQGFAAAALNALIVYLATESPKDGSGT